jgi:hypothetical protein
VLQVFEAPPASWVGGVFAVARFPVGRGRIVPFEDAKFSKAQVRFLVAKRVGVRLERQGWRGVAELVRDPAEAFLCA